MKRRICRIIWDLSEAGHLPPLGRLTPYVFGGMLGARGKRFPTKTDKDAQK